MQNFRLLSVFSLFLSERLYPADWLLQNLCDGACLLHSGYVGCLLLCLLRLCRILSAFAIAIVSAGRTTLLATLAVRLRLIVLAIGLWLVLTLSLLFALALLVLLFLSVTLRSFLASVSLRLLVCSLVVAILCSYVFLLTWSS